MFWDVVSVAFSRDLAALGILLLVAVVLAVGAVFFRRGRDIAYYCDLKKFYYTLAVLWLLAGVGFVGWELINSQRLVAFDDLKDAQKVQLKELCKHDFDEKMNDKKLPEQKKNAFREKLNDNGITVTSLPNGGYRLDFTPKAKISRWQKDWVQIRQALEKKIKDNIRVSWEKTPRTSTLRERQADEYIKWVYRMSQWRMIVWGILCLIICVVVAVMGVITGKTGTPEAVERELLGE